MKFSKLLSQKKTFAILLCISNSLILLSLFFALFFIPFDLNYFSSSQLVYSFSQSKDTAFSVTEYYDDSINYECIGEINEIENKYNTSNATYSISFLSLNNGDDNLFYEDESVKFDNIVFSSYFSEYVSKNGCYLIAGSFEYLNIPSDNPIYLSQSTAKKISNKENYSDILNKLITISLIPDTKFIIRGIIGNKSIITTSNFLDYALGNYFLINYKYITNFNINGCNFFFKNKLKAVDFYSDILSILNINSLKNRIVVHSDAHQNIKELKNLGIDTMSLFNFLLLSKAKIIGSVFYVFLAFSICLTIFSFVSVWNYKNQLFKILIPAVTFSFLIILNIPLFKIGGITIFHFSYLFGAISMSLFLMTIAWAIKDYFKINMVIENKEAIIKSGVINV